MKRRKKYRHCRKWGNVICPVFFGLSTKISAAEEKIIREVLNQKNWREEQHCERVSRLCEAIGIAIALSPSKVIELKTAGLFHDIGKIGIDKNILNKPGKLTDIEMRNMERHPEIGYHILKSINEFSSIAEFVLCHHERIDGKGYPRNLNGDDVPIQSKIISIADSFDAMTSERSYKNKLNTNEAINEVIKHSGTQFDVDIANVFIDYILKMDRM